MNDSGSPELPEVPFLDQRDASSGGPVRGLGVMAVVVNPEGIILHLRDDKPGIPHPGLWSLFGGAVEPHEQPDAAIARELREELGLARPRCSPLWRVVDRAGDGRLLIIFEARTGMFVRQMTLAEGRDFRPFSLPEALTLPLAPFARRVLRAYAEEGC